MYSPVPPQTTGAVPRATRCRPMTALASVAVASRPCNFLRRIGHIDHVVRYAVAFQSRVPAWPCLCPCRGIPCMESARHHLAADMRLLSSIAQRGLARGGRPRYRQSVSALPNSAVHPLYHWMRENVFSRSRILGIAIDHRAAVRAAGQARRWSRHLVGAALRISALVQRVAARLSHCLQASLHYRVAARGRAVALLSRFSSAVAHLQEERPQISVRPIICGTGAHLYVAVAKRRLSHNPTSTRAIRGFRIICAFSRGGQAVDCVRREQHAALCSRQLSQLLHVLLVSVCARAPRAGQSRSSVSPDCTSM